MPHGWLANVSACPPETFTQLWDGSKLVNRPNTHVVVLAAGKGTRMKSRLPKVLHQIGGLSIIERVLRTAATLTPASVSVVVGFGADALTTAVRKFTANGFPIPIQFAIQDRQLGTGH